MKWMLYLTVKHLRMCVNVCPLEKATLTISAVIKDWTTVPYIAGGQSYPILDGTNDDRVALAAPIDQRIFFAGEATDVTGEFGTISGALKSGERAAEEVVAAILEENEAS
jgi:monoamine oxidase